MASYFTLTLDSTGPDIDIFLPQLVLSSANLPIRVEAEEELEAGYQEFYIIDPNGIRHDVTLVHEFNAFTGTISLNGFPLGVSTFYARVKDTVLNPSPLSSISFNVMKGARASIQSSIKERTIQNTITSRSIKAVIK